MQRIRIATVALVAVLAVSAVAASSAFATEPYWKVNGTYLESGSVNVSATNSGNFKLKAGSLITIECTSATSKGVITGGLPGTDNSKITFSGCTVTQDPTTCEVKSPKKENGETAAKGEIYTEAKTELVLNSTQTKVLDLFTPESGTTFVELVVSGTKCPSLTKGTNKVEGSVAAEVSPEGSEAATGKLIFPTTAIKTVFLGSTETPVGLTVFGIIECIQSGTENVTLTGGGEFGAYL
jgi:hypothetical protein